MVNPKFRYIFFHSLEKIFHIFTKCSCIHLVLKPTGPRRRLGIYIYIYIYVSVTGAHLSHCLAHLCFVNDIFKFFLCEHDFFMGMWKVISLYMKILSSKVVKECLNIIHFNKSMYRLLMQLKTYIFILLMVTSYPSIMLARIKKMFSNIESVERVGMLTPDNVFTAK